MPIRLNTVKMLHSKQNVAAHPSRTPTCIIGRSLVSAAVSSCRRRLFCPASTVEGFVLQLCHELHYSQSVDRTGFILSERADSP
jgi:hypothetical protein